MLAQESEINEAFSEQTLQIKGFTQDGEVVFEYRNPKQQLVQSFGVSLKKYLAHQKVDPNLDVKFAEPSDIPWKLDHE